jgi:hypothetical protein
VTCVLYYVDFYVFELLGQTLSSFRLHPVLVAIEEIYLYGGLHLAYYNFNAPGRLQGPVKQKVEPFLAAIVLTTDQFQILLPDRLLVFRQFEPVG